jgi:NAD-dependent deacetylase
MPPKAKTLTQFFSDHSRILAFTGAGISTESGLSDYRSKGGIWDQFQPVTIQEFLVDEAKRKLYWARKKELYGQMQDAVPNSGHLALARLAERGKLRGVVTQNIDGLHHLAGHAPETILELHGTNRETICLECGELRPWQEACQKLERGEEIPLCLKCEGLLKPNTISFGQALDPNVLNKAFEWVEECDLLIACGSTLIVEPAASMPRLAKEHGARLVIVNLTETPLDFMADLVIHAPIGRTLSQSVV